MSDRWLDELASYIPPPDGYQPGDKVVITTTSNLGSRRKVVASVGYGNDWAAYVGDLDEKDTEIAKFGNKLESEIAKSLFPALAATGRYYRT